MLRITQCSISKLTSCGTQPMVRLLFTDRSIWRGIEAQMGATICWIFTACFRPISVQITRSLPVPGLQTRLIRLQAPCPLA